MHALPPAGSGGLFLKILISKTRPQIWQQVKEGVLNEFSVRGKILEARKEWVPRLQKYARLILKLRLVEVSLVAVPVNPKARAIRRYVEKALAEFEKAGGKIETTAFEFLETETDSWFTSGRSLDVVTAPTRGGLGIAKDIYKSKVLEVDLGADVTQDYGDLFRKPLQPPPRRPPDVTDLAKPGRS